MMRTFFRLMVLYFLVVAIGQMTKIHTHLHVIECELTGRITDTDGVATWRGEDCKKDPR